MKFFLLHILILLPLFGSTQSKEELNNEYKEIRKVLFTADSDSLINSIHPLLEKVKKVKHDRLVVNYLFCLAWIYEDKKTEYDKAIINYLKAVDHAEKSYFEGKEKVLISLYQNLGNIFSKFNSFNLAKEYYFKGIDLAETINDTSKIMTMNYSLANGYKSLKQYDKSISVLNYAILLSNKGSSNKASDFYFKLINRLAVYHYYNENYDSTIFFTRKKLSELQKKDWELPSYRKNTLTGYSYHNLALSYDGLGIYDSARIYYDSAISLKKRNLVFDQEKQYIINCIVDFSRHLISLGDYKTAKELLLEGEEIIIEMNTNRNGKQWYFELYDLLVQVSSELSESEAAIFYHKKYDEEIDIYTKYHQRYNMDQIVKNYFEKIDNEEREASIKLYAKTASASLLALLAFTISIYFYQKKRTQKKLKLKSIDQRLSELKALKAQINPHFLFNVLNSIQSFILENEKDIALEYLVKYGRLMRIVLEHSDHLMVSLKSEMEMLNLYTDLEKLRLKHGFSFEVILSDHYKENNHEIPSMIIQPFVENAIWHGLSPLPKEGKIIIKIGRMNDYTEIRIIDNGVGFSKQNSKSNSHLSSGIRLVSERLRLLPSKDSNKNKIEVESEIGQGTTITITFADTLIK